MKLTKAKIKKRKAIEILHHYVYKVSDEVIDRDKESIHYILLSTSTPKNKTKSPDKLLMLLTNYLLILMTT